MVASTKVRTAYIIAYLVALIVGLLLTDIPVWLRIAIGVLIMLPVTLADWYVSRRPGGSGSPGAGARVIQA
jgi:hypothetical protein